MTLNQLTIHTLTALPLHNLNRDESGAPKQIREGGVTRARLSSQSIKRAARMGFERATGNESVRSKVHANELLAQAVNTAIERGHEVTPKQEKAALRQLTVAIGKLTTKGELKQSADDEQGAKATLTWLSTGERRALVNAVVAQMLEGTEDEISNGIAQSTDSLAIAAFGRMFANAPELSMEAAISVGNATTTHEAEIALDYFTAVDDRSETSGAGHLDYQEYTSGVYYRAITIDRAQLRRNSNLDFGADDVRADLAQLVRQLILALPQGKKSGTAPFALPSVVLAEEQSYRSAYAFQQPVQADVTGGYLDNSIKELAKKVKAARLFDADAFGDAYASGIDVESFDADVLKTDVSELVDLIVEWVCE